MKRMLSLIAALIMCVCVMCPILVSADPFAPSVSYKDSPEVEDAVIEEEKDSESDPEQEDVGDCLIITSVKAAEEKTTDISQEDRDLLLQIYDQISEGTMELPLPENYVVRDLLDIDFKQLGCIEPDHTHQEDLEQENVTVTVSLAMGVKPGVDVVVLVYRDGEWTPIKSVVNKGNGTLICEFDYFGPVAFCVHEGGSDGPAQTGDTMGDMVIVWAVVLVAALVALVLLLVLPKLRKKR